MCELCQREISVSTPKVANASMKEHREKFHTTFVGGIRYTPR